MPYPNLAQTYVQRRRFSSYKMTWPVNESNSTQNWGPFGVWLYAINGASTSHAATIAINEPCFNGSPDFSYILFASVGFGYVGDGITGNGWWETWVDNGDTVYTLPVADCTITYTNLMPMVQNQWYYFEMYWESRGPGNTSAAIKFTITGYDPSTGTVASAVVVSPWRTDRLPVGNSGPQAYNPGWGTFPNNYYCAGVKHMTNFSTNVIREAAQLSPVDLNNVYNYYPMDAIIPRDPAYPGTIHVDVANGAGATFNPIVQYSPPVPEFAVPIHKWFLALPPPIPPFVNTKIIKRSDTIADQRVKTYTRIPTGYRARNKTRV